MSILEEAGKLTSGDRQKSYGHPLDDYACTAALFTALLQHAGKLRDGAAIEPELAQALMIAVKLSRLSRNPSHRDSLVDIAGYARTIEMTQEERARREPATLRAPNDGWTCVKCGRSTRQAVDTCDRWDCLEGHPSPRCPQCQTQPCSCFQPVQPK